MTRSIALTSVLLLAACDSASTDSTTTTNSTDGSDASGDTPTTSTDGGVDDAATTTPADDSGPGMTTSDDDGPGCGNGELEGDEVCDGAAGLDGVTCASLGYVAGTVACAADCTSIDESGCSETAICGDGEVSKSEACEVDISEPQACGVEGSGEQSCIDCQWNVSSCCSASCTDGCDSACGADPNDLSGTWTVHFINNGWEGPDPTMILELSQDGSVLSGSFTTDAWYLGDHEFEDGERTGNEVYMHVPITQLSEGMIMEGTVCGACSMIGVTDPQGGLDSDWVGTRDR